MTDNLPSSPVPILGFAAYSGTGKTTLLESLLPLLRQAGLRTAVIKHAHHAFDIDQPGKDSYRLRQAGAGQMLIASRYRNALISETPDEEASFAQLLARLDLSQLDLILIEGYKRLPLPKIELHRSALNKPWLHPEDRAIIAIACDGELPPETGLPRLDINNLTEITEFVLQFAQKHTQPGTPPGSCCDSTPSGMLSVSAGRAKILDTLSWPAHSQRVPLKQALGCCLAEDIHAPINVPPHTNSAMDGYAIRGQDAALAQFTVVGEVLAGQAHNQPLAPGEAVKIMTGAPVPPQADTVVMREQAHEAGGKVHFDAGPGGIKPGQNVRQAGEDLAKGTRVLQGGQRLGAAELGLLASLGMSEVVVFRPLTVAIFSTGDEVQEPGSTLKSSCIFDSNRYTLHSLLSQLGCQVLDLGIVEDDQGSLEQALGDAAEQADLVLSSGGVSVGDADYIKLALAECGAINFWRINMRPGRPLAFGHLTGASAPGGQTPFFGLPGNPVAVMVSFLQFVEPAIRKLQGERHWQPLRLTALAEEKLRSRPGRTEYSRGIYHLDANGQLRVKTTGQQGSGILRSMSEANCLIEIAPGQPGVEPGEPVTVIPLQGRT